MIPPLCVPELFQLRVAADPEAAAVVGEDGVLSYAELNTRANRLARLLISRGAGPESFVAVAVPRGTDLIVALLAVVKAGAAYLPVDPNYPADRIAYMLDDARPALVVTSAAVAGRLPVQDPLVLDDPETSAALAGQTADDPTNEDRLGPLHLPCPAYLIYTSGSTGRPKGVVVTHMGVASLLTAQIDAFDLGPGSRVLQFASPSFDAAFWELCMALLSGAALVVAPEERLAPGEPLAELLTERRVTHATLPPAVLAATSPDTRALAGGCLITAGEACSGSLVARWAPGRRMFNAYGPTESTVCATMTRPYYRTDLGNPPLGSAIVNTELLVLDAELQPVPAGGTGELHLAGPSLARGYLGRAGLTAERFVAHPSGRPGERMYRTGDLVRRGHDGTLEFLGRADHQVKVRGFRIELGEIEAVLTAHPSVAHGVVAAREDRPGVRRLVGYVVPAQGSTDSAELRRHLSAGLPAHMVPTVFVELDSVPLTPNGKVDRAVLPAPDLAAAAAEGILPRTPAEEQLCGLFAEVLALPEVRADSNFFALGGDSISAFTLVQQARTAGLALTVQDVFRYGSPEQLAARTESADRTAREEFAPPAADLAKVAEGWPGHTAVLPVTPMQHSLLASARRETGTGRVLQDCWYFWLEFEGELDADTMRLAAEALLLRYPETTAAFAHEGLRRPLQVVPGEFELPWSEHDLGDLPEDQQDGAFEKLAAAEQDRPFDVARSPLVRFALVRFGERRHRLLIGFSQLQMDGWSFPVFLDDLWVLYQHRGDDSAMPPAKTGGPYTDWLTGRDRAAAEDAWRTALEGLSGPTLVRKSDPGHHEGAPHVQDLVLLPADVTRALGERAREHGLTLNTLVLGAWGIVLGGLTGRQDTVFGYTVSGRAPEVPGIEHAIGSYANLLPVRVRWSPGAPLTEVLTRLQAEQGALIAHQHLSLTDIERTVGLPELFDATVAAQNYPVNRPASEALGAAALPPEGAARIVGVHTHEVTPHTLRLSFRADEQLFLALEYRGGRDVLARIAGQVRDLLTAAAADPGRSVEELLASGSSEGRNP
ncbi:amino acid adenylation domain-containing protein [Streptomyces sp. NPDC015184]|uniref:amino acid adenylation domain-containing protein n=1 Tax=Streptomyces sp. NPDC015184 TaxID=3364946 RepID=UPI0036F9DA70